MGGLSSVLAAECGRAAGLDLAACEGTPAPAGYELFYREAYDGLYNDVIDHGEEDEGQRLLKVYARHEADGYVALAVFGYLNRERGGHLACLNIWVDEDQRRRGLASAMYDAAESHHCDRVLPYPGNEGGAIRDFWAARLADDPSGLTLYHSNIFD